jgi:hypothetical protein
MPAIFTRDAPGQLRQQIGAGADPAVARDAVGGLFHARLRVETRARGGDRQAGRRECRGELLLRSFLGVGQNHLAAREGMYLGIALDLERRVQEVGMLAEHARHGADAHRIGQAAVRREFADHVRLLVQMRP